MSENFEGTSSSRDAAIAEAVDTADLRKETERAPTYDSFGDPDEALAWVLNRLSWTYTTDGVRAWWTSTHGLLDGLSPESLWDTDPNRVIRLAHQVER